MSKVARVTHDKPVYKNGLLNEAIATTGAVTEVEYSDDESTLRVHAIEESDGVAWRVMIRHYLWSDDGPSVKFAKSYWDSDADVLRDWSPLATGRLGGPQDLDSWESLFSVFQTAVEVYHAEVSGGE